jgi:hypothetical protein
MLAIGFARRRCPAAQGFSLSSYLYTVDSYNLMG